MPLFSHQSPRRRTHGRLLAAPVALLAALAYAVAAAGAQPPQPPAAGPISRALLAREYLRVDHAWHARRERDHARLREVNERFDKATLAFFRLAWADAIGSLRALAASLEGQPAATDAPVLIFSLSHRVLIAAQPRGEQHGILAQVETIGPVPGTPRAVTEGVLRFTISREASPPVSAQRAAIFQPGEHFREVIDLAPLISPQTPGRVHVVAECRAGDGPWAIIGDAVLDIVPESLTARRDQLTSQIEALEPPPELREAAGILARRAELLTDTPSDTRSAEFLADYTTLPAQLAHELHSLSLGADPYPRPGVWWFSLRSGRTTIPCIAYAPPSRTGPAPLVIALHGAGGDERMFIDGYGAGELLRLARERGFVVLSPLTGAIMSRDGAFDALVAQASRWYDIDPARVYVIGHSMGAAAASRLAATRAQRLAGVVCFAGGNITPRAGGGQQAAHAPTLILAAGLDPLIPGARLMSMARAAREQGLPVEARLFAEEGHTLMVGNTLAIGIDWLLERTLDRPDPRP